MRRRTGGPWRRRGEKDRAGRQDEADADRRDRAVGRPDGAGVLDRLPGAAGRGHHQRVRATARATRPAWRCSSPRSACSAWAGSSRSTPARSKPPARSTTTSPTGSAGGWAPPPGGSTTWGCSRWAAGILPMIGGTIHDTIQGEFNRRRCRTSVWDVILFAPGGDHHLPGCRAVDARAADPRADLGHGRAGLLVYASSRAGDCTTSPGLLAVGRRRTSRACSSASSTACCSSPALRRRPTWPRRPTSPTCNIPRAVITSVLVIAASTSSAARPGGGLPLQPQRHGQERRRDRSSRWPGPSRRRLRGGGDPAPGRARGRSST